MSRVLGVIMFSFIFVVARSQGAQLDSIQWVLPTTIVKDTLKDGQYLVIELPSELKDSGFIDASTKKSFAVGRHGYLALSDVDTVFSYFDQNFRANVIDIRFRRSGAERLLAYTMQWKGSKVGLILNNKLVYTAQLDYAPISSGTISLIGPTKKEDLLVLVTAIKKAASH